MSNKISARNKQAGLRPSQQLKRVDPAIAAAYTFLGRRLGEIANIGIQPSALESVIQETLRFTDESVAHNAPASVLNVLDGFLKALDQSKIRTD